MDRSPAALDPSGPARPRILIVEPDRRYVGVLGRRLCEAGFRITSATSSASALAELYRSPVDLVVAELYMPGNGGADLVRAIRSEAAWRDIPVMLITGRSEPNGAVRAYEAGADDVILKPFHFEVLFARIERRLERLRLLKTLRDDNAALDARVVARAIELGELRERLTRVEGEHRRLQLIAWAPR